MAELITIRYLPGCPHVDVVRDRVISAVDRLGEPRPDVVLEVVGDELEAERVGFRGSPTVLVDGVDAFPDPALPVGFACRVYRTEGGTGGAPSVDEIMIVLAK